MQEETKGITIGDIFKTIAVKKWITLIIAAVIAVGVILSIQLGYNRTQARYVTEFAIVLPDGYTGTSVYTYPDGTTFHYTDIISRKNLLAVKNSNEEEFKSIDIDRIVEDGDMNIERIVEAVSETSQTTEVYYRLSVSTKYFHDYGKARAFLSKLVNYPIEYLSTMKIDSDVFLTLSKEAEDYESQIELLISQLEYIKAQYENIIKINGGNFVVDGKTLSAYNNEVVAYYNINRLNALLADVRDKGILKNEQSRSNYVIKKVDVNRQFDIANETLTNLQTYIGQGIVDAATIKAQSDLVANLNQRMQDIDRFIISTTVDEEGNYEKEYINPQYDKIQHFTDTYERVVVVAYEKASTISFKIAKVLTTEGGMGVTTSVLLGIVVGVIIALISGYIIGRITLTKRAEAIEKTGSSQPVQQETEQPVASEEENNE